jgi:hypothetical protein
MSDSYELWFSNQSTRAGTVCIFQNQVNVAANVPPDQLAWIVYGANPSAWVQFKWTLDLSFIWIDQGPPRSQQVEPADPAAINSITLTYNQFGYLFSNPSAGTPGTLSIQESAGVPSVNTAMTGIGMSNAGTFGVAASPNQKLVFTPAPVSQYLYSITSGQYTFQTGDALNINVLNNPGTISFPNGVLAMTAILDSSNQWTINPGKPPKSRTLGEVVVYAAGAGVVPQE